MQRHLRPILLFTALLPGGYGLVSACSLDLDESLIPGADASTGDVQGLGGFEGGGWVDAKNDGTSNDGEAGKVDATTDATTDASEGGPVGPGIDCGDTLACALGAYCCWENGSGSCQDDVLQCPAVTIACDASDDCNAGEMCCVIDESGRVGCATACPNTLIGTIQFCDTSAECSSGVCDAPPSLIANLVPPGYKACQ